MKYSYQAVNSKGRKFKGEIEAENIDDVKRILSEKGMTALDVREYLDPKSEKAQEQLPWYQRDLGGDIYHAKIDKKKILNLLNQLAIMMRSGISVSMSMEVLIESIKDKQLNKILTIVSADLYNGTTMSDSLGQFAAFPEIVISLVAAGEANGRLDMSFEESANILHKEIQLSSKIKSAMMYPVFILVLAIAMIIVMSMFVLPSFGSVFTAFGSDLPALSKAVMAFSDWMVAYWWIVLIAVIVIYVTFTSLKKYNESFSMWLAKFILMMPIIGPVVRNNYVSRFCNLMSTLTDAGVSILKTLELSRDVITNVYMKDCFNQIIEDVKIGTPINVSMSHYEVFDSILVSMIRVGEESGMLSDSLRKMSVLYEEQADESTKRLTDSLTPIMTIIVAGIVGVVAVAIVQPMFGMYSVVAESA